MNFLRKFSGLIFITMIAGLGLQCTKKDSSSKNQPLTVIPKPLHIAEGNGHFIIDAKTSIQIIGDANSFQVGEYLAGLISGSSIFKLHVTNAGQLDSIHAIVLELRKLNSPESYQLDVKEDKIRIVASDAAGLFYGAQTLRQLLPGSIEQKESKEEKWFVPVVSIRDQPVFSWRGMHLDVSRHFFSIEFIKQFIDRLALYKFNKLHLHLTDDQGWRLQINRYPQLTEKGAWRILNNQDSACMKLALTDSAFAIPTEFFKEQGGQKLYGGFYSHADIKALVSYASERQVTIIPEIDMPGHMSAAINSFEELTCLDHNAWGKLFSTPLCPCEESSYDFVRNVLSEVASLFPGEYIHIGADEVDESSWLKSDACKVLMKKEGFKTTKQLHGYFVNRVNSIVKDLGKKTIGWDEILEGENADTTITMMYWRGWIKEAPRQAIAKGHSVIMSPTSHCYFDYAPDQTTLQHTYSFNPVPENISDKDIKKIPGIQANIWTEYIPTIERLDYMTMPRMIALAEVGWSSTKDWDDFTQRLPAHYQRMDVMNIRYRLPDIPNLKQHIVFTDTARVALNKPDGISAIRFTSNGTEPNAGSPLYNQPITIDSSVTLKVTTFGFENRPGNKYTIRYEKQSFLPAVSAELTKHGLQCRYFEGSFNSVSKMSDKEFKSKSVEKQIGLPAYVRPEVFGLEFTGLIEVPADGIYTFYLYSDDGSILQIGDRLVVDNDGFHSDVEKTGQVALKKGLHPITLRYFDGGGGNSLKLMYEGPSIAKQSVPETAFKIASR